MTVPFPGALHHHCDLETSRRLNLDEVHCVSSPSLLASTSPSSQGSFYSEKTLLCNSPSATAPQRSARRFYEEGRKGSAKFLDASPKKVVEQLHCAAGVQLSATWSGVDLRAAAKDIVALSPSCGSPMVPRKANLAGSPILEEATAPAIGGAGGVSMFECVTDELGCLALDSEFGGDPWEGLEDLAKEDFIQWRLDFIRRDVPPTPSTESRNVCSVSPMHRDSEHVQFNSPLAAPRLPLEAPFRAPLRDDSAEFAFYSESEKGMQSLASLPTTASLGGTSQTSDLDAQTAPPAWKDYVSSIESVFSVAAWLFDVGPDS